MFMSREFAKQSNPTRSTLRISGPSEDLAIAFIYPRRRRGCSVHESSRFPVARPQDAGISGGQVGAQQVVPVAPFRCLELFLVHTKLERFPRYLMAFGGYLQLHELEGAARCQQNPRGTFTFTG